MKVVTLDMDGLLMVELAVHRDQRGFFVERYRDGMLTEYGLPRSFVQENHSRSVPNVLRGLHYQFSPPQGKLVGVVRGRIWDVVVDIRPGSPTYGRSTGMELSDANGRLLWVPAGFAHGFCVLGDEPADVVYKTDAAYGPGGEGGIAWNDRDLAICWPVRDPIVSTRDLELPSFAEYRARPVIWQGAESMA